MRLTFPSVAFAILLLSNILSLYYIASASDVGSADESNNNEVEESLEEVKDMIGSALDPHPDPNEENYEGMIYIGRHEDNGKRMGFDKNNGIKYIFGTSFDESHKEIEEKDLHLPHHGPDIDNDLPHKSREQILHEKKHGKIDLSQGPKPFGHVDIHDLDGGVKPPKVVHVDPFFLDEAPVTNKQFGKFVRAVYYKTEAEQFGWSFVLSSFLRDVGKLHEHDTDPEAEHWVALDGAYWREPEGPGSSYKYRENHPVVHVSHRDAAEYCKWVGKRLPGEWEWEAAARAGHFGPNNRTMFVWGDESDLDIAKKYVNIWGNGSFPWENLAEDGWRGTSPVKTFPPNGYGFYDMSGNVWEWMRGGKHKERIVRGGSYVDSLDGSFNHAATLGARSTLHGTTSTGNVGFRCAKAPTRRVEYHWQYHDEEVHGQLAIEDEFGEQHMIPQKESSEYYFPEDEDILNDDDEFIDPKPKKKRKVIKQRTRISNEL